MGFIAGLKAFTAAVLGGIGNISGAVLGGFLLGIVETFGAAYLGRPVAGRVRLRRPHPRAGVPADRASWASGWPADGRADGGGQRQRAAAGPTARARSWHACACRCSRPRSARRSGWSGPTCTGRCLGPGGGRAAGRAPGRLRLRRRPTWSLLLALVAIVYGAAAAAAGRAPAHPGRGRRPARHRPRPCCRPGHWVFTLVLVQLDVAVERVGPGAWVTIGRRRDRLAGRPRSLRDGAGRRRRPSRGHGGRRRSTLAVLRGRRAGRRSCVFLRRHRGRRPERVPRLLRRHSPPSALALSSLGVFAGLAGPFAPHRAAVAGPAGRAAAGCSPSPRPGNTFWIRVAAQAGLFVAGRARAQHRRRLGRPARPRLCRLLRHRRLRRPRSPAARLLDQRQPSASRSSSSCSWSRPWSPPSSGCCSARRRCACGATTWPSSPSASARSSASPLNNLDPLTRGPNGISSIPDPAIGGWNIGAGLSARRLGDPRQRHLLLPGCCS